MSVKFTIYLQEEKKSKPSSNPQTLALHTLSIVEPSNPQTPSSNTSPNVEPSNSQTPSSNTSPEVEPSKPQTPSSNTPPKVKILQKLAFKAKKCLCPCFGP